MIHLFKPLKFICSFLFLCLFLSSCASFTYKSRLIFWNIPSPKDHKKFPRDIINKSNEIYNFKEGSQIQKEKIYAELKEVFDVTDVDQHLKKLKTTAFLVITNDTIVFERYYRGHQRESIQTSYSIAKSVISLLVGKALAAGEIDNIYTPITNYLPELLSVDSRFETVTIQQLLDMNSPICHNEKMDGLKSIYYPDLKHLVLTTLKLYDCPENSEIKEYNNYNTILLGIILERATGLRIADYFEQHIWTKIGTEANASWSTDKKGQAMMAAGINARAIDFAKLGKLVLDNGKWNNEELIPEKWLQESIQDSAYYWYNSFRKDYYAFGIRGQILYVSPKLNTIIVRLGSSKIEFKKPKNGSRMKNIESEFSGKKWVYRIKTIAHQLHKSDVNRNADN